MDSLLGKKKAILCGLNLQCGRHWFLGAIHRLWIRQSLCLLFHIDSWSLRGGVWWRHPIKDWLSACFPLVGLCVYSYLQGRAPKMGSIYCWGLLFVSFWYFFVLLGFFLFLLLVFCFFFSREGNRWEREGKREKKGENEVGWRVKCGGSWSGLKREKHDQNICMKWQHTISIWSFDRILQYNYSLFIYFETRGQIKNNRGGGLVSELVNAFWNKSLNKSRSIQNCLSDECEISSKF